MITSVRTIIVKMFVIIWYPLTVVIISNTDAKTNTNTMGTYNSGTTYPTSWADASVNGSGRSGYYGTTMSSRNRWHCSNYSRSYNWCCTMENSTWGNCG